MSVERLRKTPITDGGTPEKKWAASGLLFPEFSLEGCTRLVVIAPHPDDEVLGVGGLAATAVARGIDTRAVIVTDGQSSHPGSPTFTPEELGAIRQIESAHANTVLGMCVPIFLGFRDGRVAQSEQTLATTLKQYVDRAWVLVTWSGDGHPDHEACSRAARRACADTDTRLLEYPVWMWHWARPQDNDVPWARARRFTLPAATALCKARAVEAFKSQIEPLSDHPADAAVLPPFVVERLVRPYEIVFVPETKS